jgi:hypothetical protein
LIVARGERLRFSHALYREALYHDLPRARRQELHRAAAAALADAPPAETAHHLLESGPSAAAEAIDHAIRAAAQMVAVFAFEDAAALLDRARAAIPPGPLEAELRCRVLIALGETRLRGGDPTGRTLCVEAANLARTLGDATLVGRAGLAYGSVFLMGGVDPVLVAMLEEAYAALDPGTPLCALVMARLASARQPGPDRDRDLELAHAAVALARRVAGPRDQLTVLHFATGTLYGAADPSLRLGISRDQERLAEELGDVARLVQARGRIAMDHLELADFASYAENATRYEEVAARVGPAAAPWRVPLMRSTIALAGDRFEESERWQEAARRVESTRPQARRAHAFHRIGFLRAAERHAELRAAIPELRDLWLQMPYGVHLAEARVASCLARIGAEDETRAAVARLDDAELWEEINATPLGEAAWLTADARVAARIRPHLERYAHRWIPYWLEGEIVEGPSSRLLAYVCALAGEWDAAEREHARALAAIEVVGKRGLAARTRFEMGDLMLRLGRDPATARARIAAGRAGAVEVGLPELVALIDRRHGGVPASAPRRFALVQEGEYVAIETARGTLRFKASRGMEYLAQLVARPGVEVHVLELVGSGSGEGVDRGDAGEVLDATAMRAYRARLEALRDRAEDAEARGDTDAAESARDEMEAIAAELSRGTARGGAARRSTSAVDRARSAVQRRLKDAIDRIGEQDVELGAWLRRAVSTGNYCSFRPSP